METIQKQVVIWLNSVYLNKVKGLDLNWYKPKKYV